MSRKILYEAIAKVQWDGKEYSCTGESYSSLKFSQKLAVQSKAKYILKVIKTFNEIKGGETSGKEKGGQRDSSQS